MVPFHRFWSAVGLVELISTDGRFSADQACRICNLQRGPPREFVQEHVLGALPGAIRVAIETESFSATTDASHIVTAANLLGVADLLMITGDGMQVVLPPQLKKWREHRNLSTFLDVEFMIGMSPILVAEDVQRAYQVRASEADLNRYRELFMDTDFIEACGWSEFINEMPEEKARFFLRHRGQPVDYVRWSLGVPVELKAEHVLNRMISDAYFTERQLKADAGDLGVRMNKTDLDRVKAERATLFKALSMLTERQQSTGGSTEVEAAVIAMQKISVEYEEASEDDGVTLRELNL